jgi:ATP-dependent phosphofructokinase / diphosphate-dependent phosphofructokinase
MEDIMRIGLLTGGGDCPGLNAVLRGAVRRGVVAHGAEFLGYRHGWRGVLEGESAPFPIEATKGLLARGGTVLGTSRTNPVKRAGGVERVAEQLAADGVEALIAIGGEDTLGAAHALAAQGVSVVGVPKTIDNDLSGTDYTFGFHTAVQIACDAIDRLTTTAESHDRIMVIEVMGRHAGHIAAYAGMAAGADVVLVPEEPFDIGAVCARLQSRHATGASSSIVVVAEGAVAREGTMAVVESELDEFGHVRLGGIANRLASEIEAHTGYETRVTILGHLLRGGTPSAFDRIIATRFGIAAADAVADAAFDTMVALAGTDIVRVPLAEAVGTLKTIDDAFFADISAVARSWPDA